MNVPTFEECVWECWDNPDLMREYRRLTGHALGKDRRSTIERMIDSATGHEPPALDEAEVRHFLNFVRDHIWQPLVWRAVVGGT